MIIKRDDKDVRRHAFGSYICSSTHMVHNTHCDKTQFVVQKAIKFINPEILRFGISAWKVNLEKTIIDFMEKNSFATVCRSPWQMCLEQIFVTHFDIWPFSFTDYYPKNRSFLKKLTNVHPWKGGGQRVPFEASPMGDDVSVTSAVSLSTHG